MRLPPPSATPSLSSIPRASSARSQRSAKLFAASIAFAASAACGGGDEPDTPKKPIALGEPSNDVDPELIGEAVRSNSRHFQMCYEEGRERNPELAGLVELRFLINPDGSIGQVMIVETDLPTQIADCVITAFYSLQMPRQESAVIAQYPMFFQPG